MDNFLEEFKKLKEKVEALEKRTLSSLKLDSLTTGIIKPSSDSTSAIKITKADGTTTVLNIDTTNGYVGIGAVSSNFPLFVRKTAQLGTTSGNTLDVAGFDSTPQNNDVILKIQKYRTANGNDWTTEAIKLIRVTDTTEQAYISFFGNNIGIGTISPSTKLHLQNGRFRVSESDGAGLAGIIELSNGTKINYIFTGSDGHLYARTDDTSKHVLLQAGSSSGRVGIRTTSPQAALHCVGDGQTGTIIATSGNAYKSDWPGGWGGGFGTWDISCSGIYYSALSQRSDKRLKKNIKKLKIDNLIEKINYLKPVSFKWKSKDKGKDINYGFIAQDFIKIFPDLIRKDNNNYLSIDYIGIIPILVKVIQELSLKVEKLEKNGKSNKRRA